MNYFKIWFSGIFNKKADILVMLDNSYSIGRTNYNFQKEFLYQFIDKVDLKNVKLSAVSYSGFPKTEFYFKSARPKSCKYQIFLHFCFSFFIIGFSWEGLAVYFSEIFIVFKFINKISSFISLFLDNSLIKNSFNAKSL